MTIRPKWVTIFFVIVFANMVSVVHADVIWTGLYVGTSYWRLWYIVILVLLFEAGVLRWRLIPDTKKALFISLVINSVSFTLGIFILMVGTLGWEILLDYARSKYVFLPYDQSAFHLFSTVGIMLVGKVFLEILIARIIWKYPLRQTSSIFILGNILSYGAAVTDLFSSGVF